MDGETSPDHLCRAAVDLVGVTGATMVVMADRHPGGTVSASDRTAAALEELQFDLGEGPSLDAHRRGRAVLAPDLAADARFPAFGPAAAEMGAPALFAFPLQAGAIRVGVLSTYRSEPQGLSDEQLRNGLGLAEVGLQVVLAIQARTPTEQLHEVLAAEQSMPWEVHQATGMVAERLSVDLAEALVRLRAHAFATGRPLREVAAAVVRRELTMER